LPGALEIVGRRRSVEEVLELLEDDRIYFDESRGGVTFSGGEPFAQPGFLRELLEGCKERELAVVLDTCGHVEPHLFREIAPLARHLLFDLKLVDEERHEAFTGVHNRWILENLSWVAGVSSPSLTVRIPLIPGVNDDRDNLAATAELLAALDSPPPVDLLPYHRLGVDKYERMGREYGLSDTLSPQSERISFAVGILKGKGLSVTVRGELYGHD
jgi:pyruvate formate lyase activating enzyme